jgi:hypothetical protein
MAMDFYARHRLRPRCERVLDRAYAANVCTVELCEAYREITGEHVDDAYWFNVLLEADYRNGLLEVYDRSTPRRGHFTRFARDYQVVARDRDEAVGLVLEFAGRMGETNPRVREFIGEEPLKDACTGIYEVQSESLVFADDA